MAKSGSGTAEFLGSMEESHTCLVQNNIIRFTEFLMKAAEDNKNVDMNQIILAVPWKVCLVYR